MGRVPKGVKVLAFVNVAMGYNLCYCLLGCKQEIKRLIASHSIRLPEVGGDRSESGMVRSPAHPG